jgi:hypothetical protein
MRFPDPDPTPKAAWMHAHAQARRAFAAAVLSLAAALVAGSAAPAAAKSDRFIRAGQPGGTIEIKGRLSVAFPLVNTSGRRLSRVRVTSISLVLGRRVSPRRLPVSLGSIPPHSTATVFATFKRSGLRANHRYTIRVRGTAQRGKRRFTFTVVNAFKTLPAAPGKGRALGGSAPAQSAEGAKFPARKPAFDDEVNARFEWAVPIGAFRRPQKRPARTAPGPPPGAHAAQAAPFAFFTNSGLGFDGAEINEPSGASGGGVVFESANSYAAYSTNGGGNFTRLDPSTIFPQSAPVGAFCCDQIVQYVPSIDRFVWMMQQSAGARIASASPATIANSGGTAWTYWDIPSAQLGLSGFDFPDLSVGDNSLYLSTDASSPSGGGLLVVRIPLGEIRDRLTIHFQYTNPAHSAVAWFGHLAQNARDEIFWAGHASNSTMRVFSWQESSGTYFWRDVGIGSWPNDPGNMSSNTPDSRDWLSMLRADVTLWIAGATRVFRTRSGTPVNQLWFAWSAPKGAGFVQPHVQIVVLDRSNDFHLVSQMQIWNPDYAFAYPAIFGGAQGEVGMSLEYGGGGRYENHVVGFWGDFVVYTTTNSTVGTTRFGDYVTIRPHPGEAIRFDAFGYGLNTAPGGGTTTDTRYVVFGRP